MSSNTKRIAKNTLLLYFRQILIILISLYTVRVKLNVLGFEDFGIYNIVAGFVLLFTFINSAMTNATQRFLNFSMGENNNDNVRDVFSISIMIHILIAIVFIILAETLGLYFIKNYLNIPYERYDAAIIVYQLTIIITAVNIIKVPYDAIIIAYEKMSFFAFLSIIESIFNLIIVILLSFILYDKLILYAFLFLLAGFLIFFINKIYCNKMFKTSHFIFSKDKSLFRQIAEFSGWNVFGQFAVVCQTQGGNILLNIFHGVIVNAAMGIAAQTRGVIYRFISNFQTAFKPQLVKSYAAKDYEYFTKLIFQTSKISYFLLFILALPICINLEYLFLIWLKNIPEYSVIFSRLMFINSLSIALSGPLLCSIFAIGIIKNYQIISSIILLINLPISFLLLFFGFNPVWILIIRIILDVFLFIYQIFYLKRQFNFSLLNYIKEVIFPIIIITSIILFFNILIYIYYINFLRLILSCAITLISSIILGYFIVLNTQEKLYIKDIIIKYLSKKNVSK